MNGEVIKHFSYSGHNVMFGLKSEEFVYLKEKSGCVDQSFWDLWEPFYYNHDKFKNCPYKCSAITLPNSSTPICNSTDSYLCAWSVITPAFNDYIRNDDFPKTCTILQYSGNVESDKNTTSSYETQFMYSFTPPITTIVYEEYLIYDAFGLIGSVGGTLGMCVGFSFSGVINSVVSFLSSIRNKCT